MIYLYVLLIVLAALVVVYGIGFAVVFVWGLFNFGYGHWQRRVLACLAAALVWPAVLWSSIRG